MLPAHLLEIETSVNASKQVIFGDVVIEANIAKQLRRLHPPFSAKQHEERITPANTIQPQTKSTV